MRLPGFPILRPASKHTESAESLQLRVGYAPGQAKPGRAIALVFFFRQRQRAS